MRRQKRDKVMKTERRNKEDGHAKRFGNATSVLLSLLIPEEGWEVLMT